MLRKNKAITLIALVVTIIVLLILAGISITMLIGQNGILNRVQEAKEKTEAANEDEIQRLQSYEEMINKYKDLPKREGTTPYLPNSSFSYKEGDLNTGLVIKDSDNNEYVWVEVPRTTNVYKTAGINIIDFTNENYNKIEADLKEYTRDYKADNYGDTNSKFITQYQDMLRSVYTNGGFWIGRYEAGLEAGKNPRTSYIELTDSDKTVTKPNMYPYNYVRGEQAQILATRMSYEGCTSSLVFGVQWDLVLKYIEIKNPAQKSNLITDSKIIGNYYNSEFILNRGKFAKYNELSNWHNFNSEEKNELVSGCKKKSQNSNSSAVLLTTGATENAKLQNIYDLAGNVWEWTLEFYSTNNSPCVDRGGSFVNGGVSYPIKNRNGYNTSYSDNDVGFRVGLWK